MLVKLQHPEKAAPPISVTLLGMIVDLQPAIRVFVAVSIMALHPSRESYILLPPSTSMLVKLLQPEKVHLPIDVTLLGIVILVKLLQPEKAQVPIDVTLFGMVTLVKLLQPEKA